MRGTHVQGERPAGGGRIIPAHAGNTRSAGSLRRFSRDHPRACGEHKSPWPASKRFIGSSPRMRGTLMTSLTAFRDFRIIPAHAGNTDVTAYLRVLTRDHPRACGEHRGHARILVRRVGSSPRMRGTRAAGRAAGLRPGIIPAHAGNTAPLARRTDRQRDHPRACGEHDKVGK